MKKLTVLAIVLLATMSASGCIGCRGFIPLVNPTIAPTVGPSGLPTATPVPSGTLPLNFKEYSMGTAPDSFMANNVRVSHPTYYARDDLEMPVLPEKGLKSASHGVIHKLEFWNPTGENKTVDAGDFACTFKAFDDGETHYVLAAQQMFYDPNTGFFSNFVLGPSERRDDNHNNPVYLYAYISDADFEKYHGKFTVGGVAMMGLGY